MEKLHRDILDQLRSSIIADVNVHNHVLIPLETQSVLTKEDVKKISSGESREQRAEILLDILPSCGPHALGIFQEALKNKYGWLSTSIGKILREKQVDVVDMGVCISPGSPNLPPQPSLNVTRTEKINQLKQALQNIKPGCYLALHGMKGFGKSCLTANTLRDTELVKTYFTNKVYWIKFGYKRTIDDEILIQLNCLYHQVKNSDTLDSNVHNDVLKEHLVNSLKHHFAKDANRNSLLVLDDVCSKNIIDDFDFDCKTLVITDDSDFLDGKQREVMKMKDGFTEEESLGLFAKVLQIEVSKLPPEAKKIHAECKGMPILIAMFAAHFEDFKDDMKINRDRWKYYLNSLRTRDPTNRVIERFLSKQEAIFDICIDRLSPDTKSKYEALAIFSEDVNIMPQTLSVLWGGAYYVVEEQIVDLCHKSLAAKHWNVDLKSYVYGVHDLLLCHLRTKLGEERLVELHRDFIDKLKKYCNDDFTKLPKDNYSFCYIGHHLEQAKLYDIFPKLYLDFAFLEEKIYQTGLSDLLIDLKKYRKWIAREDIVVKAQVIDLEKFLAHRAGVIAEQKRRQCLDLIQIGMNYPSKRFVYKETRELANRQSNKVFVVHDGPTFTLYPNDEIPTKAKIAFFTDDPDEILIGNYMGQIVHWNCQTRSQKLFEGHNEQTAIQRIIVSTGGHYFLTLCNHGEVHKFNFPDDENPLMAQTPRQKQPFWTNVFKDELPRTDSERKFFLDNEKITDMALLHKNGECDRIGVCGDKGTFRIWTTDGNIIFTQKVESCSFEKIVFTREGTMIHLVSEGGAIRFYAENTDKEGRTRYSYVSIWNLKIKILNNEKIIYIKDIPDDDTSLVIVTDSRVISFRWVNVFDQKNPNTITQVHSYMQKNKVVIDTSSPRFTCATLTHDGIYLITADAKGEINVWHIKSALEPIATFNGRVNSLDTYWQSDDFHLILGCDENAIYRWEFGLDKLPKSVRKPRFDAIVKPWGEQNIVAKEVQAGTNTASISLYHGDTIVAKTEPVVGSIIRLSLNKNGDEILYATDGRMVMLFNLNEKKSTPIMKLDAVPGIVTFLEVGDVPFIVCGENERLKIWTGGDIFLVKDTGHVMSIYKIDEESVVTVARNGIKFFRVQKKDWDLIEAIAVCTSEINICHCSINVKNNLIALLMTNGEMMIYEIIKDRSVEPTHYGATEYVKFMFNQQLACCEFSHDDIYLAIGFDSGDISIFDITGRCELSRLQLHCNEVRELHWAPVSIGAPILLSVNCDELAWWNVALSVNYTRVTRRSRMGMSRSTSAMDFSPRSSVRLPISQSIDSNMSKVPYNRFSSLTMDESNDDVFSNVETNGTGENGHGNKEPYWKTKMAKKSNRNALMTVVPLPPSCNSKVCVSSDFSKFLSIDIHGIVSNFQFFNYNP